MKRLKGQSSLPTQQQFHDAINRRGDVWYAACRRITHNDELANDAVQEALLSAWQKRAQYRESAQLETWIHRIAVNCALTLLRKHKRAIWLTLDQEPEAQTLTPTQLYSASEIDDELSDALKQLTDMERVCFVLKHLEEWRLKEIAEHLSLGTGQVKQALFRAVAKLRKSMIKLKVAK